MTTTYAKITELNIPDEINDDTEIESSEPEKLSEHDKKEKLKLDYLDENDLRLYDFINDLKDYWKDLGFMNTLKHESVVRLLRKTINVTEIIIDDEDCEEEYEESEFYE